MLLACALAASCAAPAPATPPEARAAQPVIFGADDRHQPYEASSPGVRDTATRSVAALFHSPTLDERDPANVLVRARPLGERWTLCSPAAFEAEPSSAHCSSTLIDDDLLLTAGHCVDEVPCAMERWVFGWYYDAPGHMPGLSAENVFTCRRVVVRRRAGESDYAIVQLDRAATGRMPVPVRATPPTLDERITLIGYPLGIPAKVVEGGSIISVGAGSFDARVDALPGNSGSGAFDGAGRLLGDLFAGPAAHVYWDGACRRLTVFPDDSTRGESISLARDAVAELCAGGFPSERLCGRAGSCGDGTCAGVETAASCPLDCPAARCGDGLCSRDEVRTCAAGDDCGPQLPPAWRCDANQYASADGCDCACGAVDPDCALAGATTYNCTNGQVCVAGECSVEDPDAGAQDAGAPDVVVAADASSDAGTARDALALEASAPDARGAEGAPEAGVAPPRNSGGCAGCRVGATRADRGTSSAAVAMIAAAAVVVGRRRARRGERTQRSLTAPCRQ